MTADLIPGDLVTWAHEMRGGYGYVEHIPGTLLVIRGDLAKIEVRKTHGQPVTRWVKRAHLTRREAEGR